MFPRPPIILYVERNQMLLQTVRDVLEFAGWYVKPCQEAFRARAILQYREYFDLLLIDNELSSISGLELIGHIRRVPHRQQIPIILISLEDLSEEAIQAGANAFLRKPNNLIDLVDTIRRLLAPPADA